jgi:lipid-A-disaccharide synthase
MRRMRYQPWVGLPNILCGRFVVPEFLQDDAKAVNLAQALGNLVDDREICSRIAGRFTQLHLQLRQGSAERAATAILGCLKAGACMQAA